MTDRHASHTSRTPRASFGGATGIVMALMVVVVLGSAGYLAVRSRTSDTVSSDASRDLVVAQIRSFDIATVASGTIEARNRVEVRSKVEARSSISFVIDEGTRVRKGDVLLRLNTDTIEKEITSQQLDVNSALATKVSAENDVKNQIDQNESNIRKADLKVELAKLGLAQWEEEDKKEHIRLEQVYDSAERNLNRLIEKVEESKRLTAAGYYSVDKLQLDEMDLEEARARIKTATLDKQIYRDYRRVTDKAQADSDYTEALAERDRTERAGKNTLASSEATLRNREEQLRIREQRLTKVQAQLAMCEMRAPTDGLVVFASSLGENRGRGGNSESSLQVGTEVRFNEMLMILPDTTEMRARVRVNEALSGKVRKGQRATITVNALGKATFTAVVDSISVLAEGGGWRDPNRREYTVFLTLTGGEALARLKPSMRCNAEIQLGHVDDSLSIPVPAVFTEGPVRYVYTMDGASLRRVPVKIGARSGTFAQILAGIDEGARVLVREPDATEIESAPWDSAQLQLVGLKLDDEGNPVAERGARNSVERSKSKPDRVSERKADAKTIATTETKNKAESTVSTSDAQSIDTSPTDTSPSEKTEPASTETTQRPTTSETDRD